VSDIATMVTDKGKISVVLYRYIHIHDTWIYNSYWTFPCIFFQFLAKNRTPIFRKRKFLLSTTTRICNIRCARFCIHSESIMLLLLAQPVKHYLR
jgi:hypothetical protein